MLRIDIGLASFGIAALQHCSDASPWRLLGDAGDKIACQCHTLGKSCSPVADHTSSRGSQVPCHSSA